MEWQSIKCIFELRDYDDSGSSWSQTGQARPGLTTRIMLKWVLLQIISNLKLSVLP